MEYLRFIKNFIIFFTLIKFSESVPVHKWYEEDNFSPFFIETEAKYNWFEAWTACAVKNMTLAAVDTPEKNAALVKIMKTKLGKRYNVWIGGNDLGENGAFIWYATGKRFEFTNWSPGNPDHSHNVEHCVHYYENTDYEWNDANCVQKMGYICEENRFIKEMRHSWEIKKNFIDQLFEL